MKPYLLSRVYLGLLLAAAGALLPGLSGSQGLPYAVLSGALLAVLVYVTLRPRGPAFNVVFDVMLAFLAPPVLAAVMDGVGLDATYIAGTAAVILTLPALLLLDESLQKYTRRRQVFSGAGGERRVTQTFAALAGCSLAVMVLGLVLGRPALLLAGAALLLYLIIVLGKVWASVPRPLFAADTVLKRVIAGTQGGIFLGLSSRAPLRLYCRAAPVDAWVRARPAQFVIEPGSGARLELSFKPALAGECQPALVVSALDPRGLVHFDQRLEPLQLHVIPMARYAEWLARKYLEQAEAGVIADERLTRQRLQAPKGGADYLESRAYQPGDPLKDIDWKHTAKLNQLIVNTYGETGQQAAIIAANLEVASAAEADRLAFNLITVALTLARENVPAALAVYDRHRVVANTGIIDTLEVLKQTLTLVRQVAPAEMEGRHLEPTDVAKVRRNIRQLQQADSEPARRLLEIFNFEHKAVEEVARNNPATLALNAAAAKVPAPATIFLVSQLNHDAEAVLVATEKLARRKFKIVPVENK
jgi:uncharacterized protein (DUF58 family)